MGVGVANPNLSPSPSRSPSLSPSLSPLTLAPTPAPTLGQIHEIHLMPPSARTGDRCAFVRCTCPCALLPRTLTLLLPRTPLPLAPPLPLPSPSPVPLALAQLLAQPFFLTPCLTLTLTTDRSLDPNPSLTLRPNPNPNPGPNPDPSPSPSPNPTSSPSLKPVASFRSKLAAQAAVEQLDGRFQAPPPTHPIGSLSCQVPPPSHPARRQITLVYIWVPASRPYPLAFGI